MKSSWKPCDSASVDNQKRNILRRELRAVNYSSRQDVRLRSGGGSHLIFVQIGSKVHLIVYKPFNLELSEAAMADSIHLVMGLHEHFRNVTG